MATTAVETGSIVSLGDDDFETVVESTEITLVEFYTEWCGTCERMKPILQDIAADTAATVVTVDIERNLETAIEFGAQSTPTFILFADGRPVKQLKGGQTEQSLRDLISKYSN
jgi:thioredoxin 1